MQWQRFGTGEKLAIIGLVIWWILGAWGASALGFRDPLFIMGLPFLIGFIVVALLEGAMSLKARLRRL